MVPKGSQFCPYCGFNILGYLSQQTSYQYRRGAVPTPASPHPRGILSGIIENFRMIFTPRPPLYNITSVVYDRLPPAPYAESKKLVAIGVGLTLFFYLISGITDILRFTLPFLIAYVIAGLYLYWIYRSDKFEPEPLRFVFFAFAWGIFSGLPAGILNSFIGMPIFKQLTGIPALSGPFVEEPLKILGVYWLAKHTRYGREFNGPMDGFVYGFAAGMGFEAMENFSYFLSTVSEGGVAAGWGLLFLRSIAFGFGHGVFTGLAGWWLGVAKARKGFISGEDLSVGLAPSITLHAAWNIFASIFPILNFILAFGLLLITKKVVSEAIRDEIYWGYAMGYAPTEKY